MTLGIKSLVSFILWFGPTFCLLYLLFEKKAGSPGCYWGGGLGGSAGCDENWEFKNDNIELPMENMLVIELFW